MPQKDNLFKLIKSLSKTEKRHFKLFASLKTESSNYIKLFDAINRQEVYDEKLIKHQFGKENFTKQLHVTKNLLTKLILKSLRNYYSNISIEAELNILLGNIEILYKKELYELCDSEIKRAERLAETYEKFSQHLLLCTWKRKIILAKRSSTSSAQDLEILIRQEKEILQKRMVLNEYWMLVANIPSVFKGAQSWDSIMKQDILTNINAANSLQSRILYYHLYYTYYITNEKIPDASRILNKLIAFIEEYPFRITDDPSSYITTLNNKIGLLLTTKKYDEIPDLISKIRSVPESYNLKGKSDLTVKLLLRTYNVELEMLRDTERWDAGTEKIYEINNFIKLCKEEIPQVYKLLFYYQFSYIFFRKKNLPEALKWTNEIINGKFDDAREDILSYARFLNLIIHFELNNIYVLKYAVDATRRFLKKKRNLQNFEKVLLNFFSKVSTSLPEKHPQLLGKLKEEIFINTADRQRANILDYLNFEEWIDEKLR